MRAVGRSTSEDTNAKDWSRVDGGSKTRGLVTTRTKPDRTRTERANGSGPVARRVIQVAYSAWSGMEPSTCAYIRILTSGSSILNHRLPCPNRASSSCASRALGRSRSTPGRAWTPRTVTSRNGGDSDVSRRFRASSNVLAIKALTLMPRASAARRTCFASWSSSEIVVLMMHQHNIPSSLHQTLSSDISHINPAGCAVFSDIGTRCSRIAEHLMGENTNPRGKLRFDRRVRLEFRGATITSDAGLPLPRLSVLRRGLGFLVYRYWSSLLSPNVA